MDAGTERDSASSPLDSGPTTPDATVPPDARPDAAPDSGLDAGVDGGPSGPMIDVRIEALMDPSASVADLEALMDEVRWAEGWPVTDGARWLFATRWDAPPGAVSLVSDINSWTPARAPATRAASGVHYWVVIDGSSFDAPAAGAKYKWHGAPDTYRAPPEARAYGFDTYGEHGYVAPPVDSRWRERFDRFASAHLGPTRAFRALLPAGFRRGDPARVLLLHDGQNVLDPDAAWGGWRVDEAVSAPRFADVVVTAVDNAPDRFDAYTHVPDDIGTGGSVGGRADDYARLVFDEALPFFRAHYGLRAARQDLVIGGSSLGGLVSLYLALSHPADVSCVIAMSPTLGWGAFDARASGADALVRRWTGHGATAVYLDSGGRGTCTDRDGDGVQEDSADSDNYCTTVQLRDRLASLGYAFDADLFHHWEPDATHNEAAWAARVPGALSSCVTAGWSP